MGATVIQTKHMTGPPQFLGTLLTYPSEWLKLHACPLTYIHLGPHNETLFGKNSSAGVIKDLEIMLDYPVGPNPLTNVLIRDTQRRDTGIRGKAM